MNHLSLSDALFTVTQQRILGLLFGKPDQSFYTNEIARWAQVGKGSLMRELERLQNSGVLRMTRQGNQTHYQANTHCPIYAELLGIVRKTIGIAEPIRQALEPFSGQLKWAFVYGSIAKAHALGRATGPTSQPYALRASGLGRKICSWQPLRGASGATGQDQLAG